jgi:hypothetical protein
VRNRLECGTCCAPVSTCGHVCARVAPCAHLLAPVRTRGCSWLGCSPRSDAAARPRRFTCNAVSCSAASDRQASRHDAATRAEQAPCVITSRVLRQLVRSADVRNRVECGTCCAPVSTCGHVSARVAPGAHLHAPVRTRGCGWLGCGTRSAAAAPSQRFTYQAVAGIASSVRPASRHDSAARAAEQAPCVITSCASRQLVRIAMMCEIVFLNAAPAPVSTCGHVSARVAPCAHLLTPVRTRAKPSQLLRGAWRPQAPTKPAALHLWRATCQAVACSAAASATRRDTTHQGARTAALNSC